MAITKKKVATAVDSVAKKAAKPAESVSTSDDLEAVFKIQAAPSSTPNAPKKEYYNFLGKDRLIRTMPITWNPTYKGKDMRFVIYHDESCPGTKFGSLADLEYLEKRYPIWDKWFINDDLCSNGRHRFVVYRIKIIGVVDHVE